MNDAQARLRGVFLTTAKQVKRTTGAPDNDVIGAMLSAAHGFALRRDATFHAIETVFGNDPRDRETAA